MAGSARGVSSVSSAGFTSLEAVASTGDASIDHIADSSVESESNEEERFGELL